MDRGQIWAELFFETPSGQLWYLVIFIRATSVCKKRNRPAVSYQYTSPNTPSVSVYSRNIFGTPSSSNTIRVDAFPSRLPAST